MWEPASAIVLSIFLTFLLFLTVYSLAYGIIKGGIFTFRKIKEEFNKDKQEISEPKTNLGMEFPKRDSVINSKNHDYRRKQ